MSVCIPVLLSYSGDIWKKRITPFYNISAGYAFPLDHKSSGGYDNYGKIISMTIQGGPAGSLALGAKLHAHKVYIKWSLECLLFYSKYFAEYEVHKVYQEYYMSRSGAMIAAQPVFTFTMGFEK